MWVSTEDVTQWHSLIGQPSLVLEKTITCKHFFIHTCAEVSFCKGLQDAVHGSHVEDESQLSDTHSDEAEQEDGAEDTTHEWLG